MQPVHIVSYSLPVANSTLSVSVQLYSKPPSSLSLPTAMENDTALATRSADPRLRYSEFQWLAVNPCDSARPNDAGLDLEQGFLANHVALRGQ